MGFVRVLGYVRVSTDGQAEKGASLGAQKYAIADECSRRGWELVDIAEDALTAKRTKHRPGLEYCLKALDAGEFDGLVVARLDRAFRSLGHFAETLDRSDRKGWQMVLLDPPVDTSTPFGRAMAGMAAVWAELERALIGQRTREGMAEKARLGTWKNGRRPGRQMCVPDEVVELIRLQRQQGLSYQRIAHRLNEEQVRTAQGGQKWYSSTVRGVLKSREGVSA